MSAPVIRATRATLVLQLGAIPANGGGGGVTSHPDLDDLAWTSAGHTGSNLGLAGWDADGAAAVVASTAFGRSLLNAADQAAGLTAIGAQAASAELTAIAGVSSGYGFLTRNGIGGWDLAQILGSAPIEVTDGGATLGSTTIGIADASEAARGVVQLAADGDATPGRVVQAQDARLQKGSYLPLIHLAAAAAVTNLPAAATEIFNTDVNRTIVVLTGYSLMTLIVRRGTGAATAGSSLKIQYTTDLSGATGWTDIGLSLDVTAGSTRSYTAETSIPSGAKGSRVMLRAVTSGGNGVDDPTISQVGVLVQ